MDLHKFRIPGMFISLGLLTSNLTVAAAQQPIQAPQHRQQCPPQNFIVTTDTAVIFNTGSTNSSCFRILVSPTGQAHFVQGNQSGKGRIPRRLTRKFFQDISAAEPLSQMPAANCMKSVSFGTSTFIRLGGEQSPDISCVNNAKAKALVTDVEKITQMLYIGRPTSLR
jgi:hypothetical protein